MFRLIALIPSPSDARAAAEKIPAALYGNTGGTGIDIAYSVYFSSASQILMHAIPSP